MAQLVEHMLGKHEVPGPNPGSSSNTKNASPIGEAFFALEPPLSLRIVAAQPPGSTHPPAAGRAVFDAILSKAPSGRELSRLAVTEGVPGSLNKQRNKLYSCFVL